jgi:hypothetical protein
VATPRVADFGNICAGREVQKAGFDAWESVGRGTKRYRGLGTSRKNRLFGRAGLLMAAVGNSDGCAAAAGA